MFAERARHTRWRIFTVVMVVVRMASMCFKRAFRHKPGGRWVVMVVRVVVLVGSMCKRAFRHSPDGRWVVMVVRVVVNVVSTKERATLCKWWRVPGLHDGLDDSTPGHRFSHFRTCTWWH